MPGRSLLARYVLTEVAVPLVNWLVFFFFLFLAMSFLRGTELLLGSAVGVTDLLGFVLNLTPHFLQQAMPIAFLLAVLLGLGRLAEDGELTALRSVGVGPWKLVRWPLALGAVLGALSLLAAFTVEPWGMRAVTRDANALIKRNVMGDVKPGVFYDDIPNFVLYVERVVPGTGWENVLIHDSRDAAQPQLLLAQTGKLVPEGTRDDVRLLLSGGNLHRTHPEATGDYAVADFARGQLVLSVEGAMGKNTLRRPHEELTPGELLDAAKTADQPLPLLVAFHNRLGRAVMPLAFAVLATALAFRARGRGRAFLLCLVGYVLYYVLMQVGAGLGSKGQLPPVVAGQLANAVFFALGLWAMRRASREGTTA